MKMGAYVSCRMGEYWTGDIWNNNLMYKNEGGIFNGVLNKLSEFSGKIF